MPVLLSLWNRGVLCVLGRANDKEQVDLQVSDRWGKVDQIVLKVSGQALVVRRENCCAAADGVRSAESETQSKQRVDELRRCCKVSGPRSRGAAPQGCG